MTLDEQRLPDNGFYVVVTGANSGLGLGICTRLIDEFLQTRPQDESLVLTITTRDQVKGDATIEKLLKHVHNVCRKKEKKVTGISMLLQRRICLRQERLDLLSLLSVQKLAKRLRETLPRLDVLICNAGIGGWTGLNWPLVVWTCLTNLPNATVWPTFKIAGIGWKTKPQLPSTQDGQQVEEPPIGEVFCANLFGHYVLGHYIAPLLARHGESEQTRGRVIWTSSLDAYHHSFDMDDFQGLKSIEPYEHSKRLTDLMGIAARLPPAQPLVSDYLSHPEESTEKTTQPRIYLAHPGISASSIVPLHIILEYCMVFAFFIGRCLGQQWHNVSAYKGAVSMVWLTLAKQSTLDTMEENDGVAKWGSASDVWGNERVERTDTDGWGWSGKVGHVWSKKGRSPWAQDATEASVDEFKKTGTKCWAEMEKLRIEWEERLEKAGVGIDMD